MTTPPSYCLAPLQRLMLQDSLSTDGAGQHVEQVEIVFSQEILSEHVISAWRETVARTEALRITFINGASEMAFLKPADYPKVEATLPDSWHDWLETDRARPLLMADGVPWRATFWPLAGRFIWTFHHALLDGRSIVRVLREFLKRVAGGSAENLTLSKWHQPSAAELAMATGMIRKTFADLEPVAFETKMQTSLAGPAICCMGPEFAGRLESMANSMDTTSATLITWAWGQALAEGSDADAVMVEQVRAGAPQIGTAGFTMNTLPVLIHRADEMTLRENLREFRARLWALREIESVSATDFPPGIFPDTNRLGASVIMVEHGTLRHMIGPVAQGDWIESLELHECLGESLTATAHILPDLRLQVEGPDRQGLLARWVIVLRKLVSSDPWLDPQVENLARTHV